MDPQDVDARIRGEDIHYPDTSLVCMENAHASGRLVPLDAMAAVTRVARNRGIPVHLDGARLFNAAAGLGVPASEVAGYADSVMFCLSKGLCAPVGSMLAGPKDFIAQARRKRKIMGGGMRQAGILAAAGLIALREMTRRLAEDHQNAKVLAGLLAQIPGVSVDLSTVDINMVFFTVQPEPDPAAILAAMARRGIVINPPENGHFRFVTHYWVDAAKVTKAAAAFAEALSEVR
jgi:threonine aldolase